MPYKDSEKQREYQRLWEKEHWKRAPDEFKEKNRANSRKYYAKNKVTKIAQQEEKRRRRKAILDQIKLEIGCLDCGYNLRPEALEFDHRPGEEKIFELGEGYKFPAEKVQKEMAKCDLVCSNCHRIRTADRWAALKLL